MLPSERLSFFAIEFTLCALFNFACMRSNTAVTVYNCVHDGYLIQKSLIRFLLPFASSLFGTHLRIKAFSFVRWAVISCSASCFSVCLRIVFRGVFVVVKTGIFVGKETSSPKIRPVSFFFHISICKVTVAKEVLANMGTVAGTSISLLPTWDAILYRAFHNLPPRNSAR
jgi:hypothetical protein